MDSLSNNEAAAPAPPPPPPPSATQRPKKKRMRKQNLEIKQEFDSLDTKIKTEPEDSRFSVETVPNLSGMSEEELNKIAKIAEVKTELELTDSGESDGEDEDEVGETFEMLQVKGSNLETFKKHIQARTPTQEEVANNSREHAWKCKVAMLTATNLKLLKLVEGFVKNNMVVIEEEEVVQCRGCDIHCFAQLTEKQCSLTGPGRPPGSKNQKSKRSLEQKDGEKVKAKRKKKSHKGDE